MIRLAAPGMNELRPIGKYHQHPSTWDALHELLGSLFRTLIHPMKIFISAYQGPSLCALQGRSLQRAYDPIFLCLWAHGDFVDAAFFHREKFKEVRQGGRLIDPQY